MVLPVRTAFQTYQAQKQVEQERISEEEELRRQHEAAQARLAQESRQQFELELEEQRGIAKRQWEAELVKTRTQAQVESDIQKRETQERAKFEQQLKSERQQIQQQYRERVSQTRRQFEGQLQQQIQQAKREAARQKTYRAISPRQLRTYAAQERRMFEEAVGAEKEVFGEKMVSWEEKAKQEFEVGLRAGLVKQEQALREWEIGEEARFGREISAYEKEARKGYKAELEEWRIKGRAEFQEYLVEWRKQWKPKSVAERLLEVAVPELPKFEIELLKIPIGKGKAIIGLDVGRFFEELAGGTKAAAAGVVASGESFIYGVAGLAGIPTPRPPPTLVSGVITSGIASVIAGELKPSPQMEEMAARPYGVTYAAASLLGDILLAKGIGIAAEKTIIQPIAKTRVGRYVGYQFKVHAPKPLLRLVYGKKAAQYIVKERLPYEIGKLQMVTPSGKVITQAYKIPKAAELTTSKYLREILSPTGVSTRADFPLIVTKGQRITPFRTTFMKGIKEFAKETRGAAQILAPLETARKVVSPQLPALAKTLQFGYTPLIETLPTTAALAAELTLGVRAAAVAKPAIKPVERLKPKVTPRLMPAVSEALGLEQPVMEIQQLVQAPVQVPISAQISALQMQLQFKPPKPPREEKVKRIKAKRKRKLAPWEKRGLLVEHPILEAKKLPTFIRGRLPKQPRRQAKMPSLGNVLFGRKQKRSKRKR